MKRCVIDAGSEFLPGKVLDLFVVGAALKGPVMDSQMYWGLLSLYKSPVPRISR